MRGGLNAISVEHLAQVEVAAAGVVGVIIDLVEVVEDTTVAVVIMVLEVVVSTEMVATIILVGVVVEAGVEEDTIEVVVVTVVLMTTVVAEVAAMGDEIRRTKGVVKVPTVLVAMGKLLLRMVVLRVIMQHLRAPMEATMLMVQILQCRLLIATVVAQAHTHQAMVPRLHTNMVVPQEGKGVCLLHMMVDMVVGPCLGVEDLGVHRHLIVAALVFILVVLVLNQLEKSSNVMKIVTRHVTMQGFTYQICLLMSLLRNYRSYLEESARYN